MSKHTPGPWFLGDGGHLVLASSSDCVAILCDAEGDQFASMNTHSVNTVTPEQRRANGVIMAAAPDLLEACELVLFALDEAGVECLGKGIAKAAIQKAKGES